MLHEIMYVWTENKDMYCDHGCRFDQKIDCVNRLALEKFKFSRPKFHLCQMRFINGIDLDIHGVIRTVTIERPEDTPR